MLGMNYQNIQSGLSTAFLDKNISSNVLYRPQFISNDYKNGRKVPSTIEDELLHCDSFSISVAFITMGGITPLLQTLRTLEDKGIHGKILTIRLIIIGMLIKIIVGSRGLALMLLNMRVRA